VKRFDGLIFVTGAAALALEVLASRILIPYFGVSLYIWSGILSITLAFLAAGYILGGRATRRLDAAGLEARCLAAPVLAAAAIAGAAAVYPAVFPALTQGIDLIAGSYVGATLLLALPLVALSAMNPLLVALARARGGANGGDAGAGRVFFISTVGSVAGVLLTAFLLIPTLTNYAAFLASGLALVISSANLAGATLASRKRLAIGSGAVAAVLVLLLGFKDAYLSWLSPLPSEGVAFSIRHEYGSMFGNIKVVDVRRGGAAEDDQKLFLQDGLLQNRTSADNRSLSTYTYILESLALAYAPGAKDAVVLGLGAGIVPRELKTDGLAVSVVEINSDALAAARDNFAFDPGSVTFHLEDARTYVRGCRAGYDVAVVDLFQGDNTPDYLMTREFFADLRQCLRPNGVLVMNAFFDESDDGPNQRLLATVKTAFPRVFRYGFPQGNAFIVGAAADKVGDPFGRRVPASMTQQVTGLLGTGREVRPEYYVGFEPVSDDHNLFGVLFANAQMRLRRALAGQLPPRLLVN
jgi:predicted membrane-bound spermidine synthase